MKAIDFCKDKIAGLKAFFTVAKNNRLITLMVAGLFFALSTVASNVIGKATEYFIPTLDDSAAIIENQNKQFDVVKENLQKLQNSITGSDREYLSTAFDTIKDMKNESDNLAVRLAALQDENKSLKQTLKSTKGVYGGVDIIVPDESGFKIDGQTSFGYKEYGSGLGVGSISLTSANQDENVKNHTLRSGEGVYFTNENNKKCSLVFNGNTKVVGSDAVVGNFVVACKK
jgi:hypothetical protein